MERLLIALAVVAVAAVVSEVVRRRRSADAPTQSRRELPSQLDRSDFPGDNWLVTIFTSESCSTCADVVRKAKDRVFAMQVLQQDYRDAAATFDIGLAGVIKDATDRDAWCTEV